MTIPFAVDAVALATYREWEQLTNELSVASAKLAAAADANRYDEAMSLVPQVEGLVQRATNASQRYVAFKIPVDSAVMTRWKSVLVRSQAAVTAARGLKAPTRLAPVVVTAEAPTARTVNDLLDSGFQIPGTKIVVPWVAVVGVAAVVVAGLYFSRRRR